MRKVLTLIFLMSAVFIYSQDYGFILHQNFVFGSSENIEYTALGIPWFAAPIGKKADVYLSASAGAELWNDWKFLFEVNRFEIKYNPLNSLSYTFGRQNFSDSHGLIMSGLFDGISLSANIKGSKLNAGIFYTGLLYKRTAFITLSQNDMDNYNDNKEYFSSKRIAGGINWEKTSIFDTQGNLWLSGIFQSDLNNDSQKIHSEYLAARFSAPLGNILTLDLGAIAELLQQTNTSLQAAFAASADLHFMFSKKNLSLLSLGGLYSTGNTTNNAIEAFKPLTGVAQGKVLRPNLSGLALMQISYNINLNKTLSAEAYTAYLFRTDTVSVNYDGMDQASLSPALGGEFYLCLSWAPFSDLFFSLGAGIFVPQMGKAFLDDAKIKYRIELTAGISL